MEASAIKAALLSFANDQTTTVQYGDGLLVDLPLTYSDGDSVRVFVEPYGAGFRISDRSEAMDRLAGSGLNLDSGRAAAAVKDTLRSSGLNMLGSARDELTAVVDEGAVGAALIALGVTALRTEQLRWLAGDRASEPFPDRVVRRLVSESANRWQVRRSAQIRLRSGRQRQVTAVVEGFQSTAYVQALAQSEDRAVEHCYFIFDRAEVDRRRLIAALGGTAEDWSAAVTSDLADVAQVTYFDEPNELERAIEGITGVAGSLALP